MTELLKHPRSALSSRSSKEITKVYPKSLGELNGCSEERGDDFSFLCILDMEAGTETDPAAACGSTHARGSPFLCSPGSGYLVTQNCNLSGSRPRTVGKNWETLKSNSPRSH